MNVDEIHLYSSRISGIFGKNIQSLQMTRIDICRDQKTQFLFANIIDPFKLIIYSTLN